MHIGESVPERVWWREEAEIEWKFKGDEEKSIDRKCGCYSTSTIHDESERKRRGERERGGEGQRACGGAKVQQARPTTLNGRGMIGLFF